MISTAPVGDSIRCLRRLPMTEKGREVPSDVEQQHPARESRDAGFGPTEFVPLA